MYKAIFSVGVGIIISMLFSCGIFTPRTVEKPGGEVFSDPFHLYSILDKTGEQFTKTSYEDIFDSTFQFIAWDNATYNRYDEIEKLKTLKASCNCDSFSTVWDTCEGVGEKREESSMTLCRTFFLTYYSDGSKDIDSGKVQFKLNRSAGNIWTIVLWEEQVSRSVFHP